MNFCRFSIARYMKVLTQFNMKECLWTDDLASSVLFSVMLVSVYGDNSDIKLYLSELLLTFNCR